MVIREEIKFKHGKRKAIKTITSPTLNQFITAIGRKYLEDYGPIKFWSALHRARREGYWAESEVISLPVKRKFGKSYVYRNTLREVYKLENELLEARKVLKDIGADASTKTSSQELNAKIDKLESLISEKASLKTEEELLVAAEKWFKSLE